MEVIKKMSEQKIKEPKYFVKTPYGIEKSKGMEIKEIYESYSGWYWLVTKYESKKTIGYGYVVGIEPEWGTFYMSELQSSPLEIWKVPKKNWSFISHVHTEG